MARAQQVIDVDHCGFREQPQGFRLDDQHLTGAERLDADEVAAELTVGCPVGGQRKKRGELESHKDMPSSSKRRELRRVQQRSRVQYEKSAYLAFLQPDFGGICKRSAALFVKSRYSGHGQE